MPIVGQAQPPKEINATVDKLWRSLNESLAHMNDLAKLGYVVRFKMEAGADGLQKLVTFDVLAPMSFMPAPANDKAN